MFLPMQFALHRPDVRIACAEVPGNKKIIRFDKKYLTTEISMKHLKHQLCEKKIIFKFLMAEESRISTLAPAVISCISYLDV